MLERNPHGDSGRGKSREDARKQEKKGVAETQVDVEMVGESPTAVHRDTKSVEPDAQFLQPGERRDYN